MTEKIAEELKYKSVFVFNFDFIVADPDYNRLKDFAKKFNKGKIETFKELKTDGKKEIQVLYTNNIRVRYIHDPNTVYLEISSLLEGVAVLKDFI